MWTRIWRTLSNPRIKTAMAIAGYALAVTIGIALVSDDVQWHDVVAGIFLIPGGLAGLITAWVGRKWVEAAATVAVIGGLTMQAVTSLWLLVFLDSRQHVILCAYVLAMLSFMVYRLNDISGQAYAEGRGPVPPVEEARVRAEVARTLFEESQA